MYVMLASKQQTGVAYVFCLFVPIYTLQYSCAKISSSYWSFCLLSGQIWLQHSLAASLRRSTTFAANMLTWRSEARLNATTWERDALIYFILGRCHHECCSYSTDLPASHPSVHPLSHFLFTVYAYLDGCHAPYLRLRTAMSPDSLPLILDGPNNGAAVGSSPDWQNCILIGILRIFSRRSDLGNLWVMGYVPARRIDYPVLPILQIHISRRVRLVT